MPRAPCARSGGSCSRCCRAASAFRWRPAPGLWPGVKGRVGGRAGGTCQRRVDVDTRSRQAVTSGRLGLSVCRSVQRSDFWPLAGAGAAPFQARRCPCRGTPRGGCPAPPAGSARTDRAPLPPAGGAGCWAAGPLFCPTRALWVGSGVSSAAAVAGTPGAEWLRRGNGPARHRPRPRADPTAALPSGSLDGRACRQGPLLLSFPAGRRHRRPNPTWLRS